MLFDIRVIFKGKGWIDALFEVSFASCWTVAAMRSGIFVHFVHCISLVPVPEHSLDSVNICMNV